MKIWKMFGSLAMVLTLGTTAANAASLTIPAGVTISVRMTDALDSKVNSTGETFHAVVDAPVSVDGQVVVPKGAEAIGRVTNVADAGRFKGRSTIAVELTALNFEGKSMAIHTSAYSESGSSRTKQTAKIAGGATVVGTIVGFAVGMPILGTGVGAATGMTIQSIRGPKVLRIPTESLLVFTLQSPLPVDGDQ